MVDSERRRRRLRRGQPGSPDVAAPAADVNAPPARQGPAAETAGGQDPVPELGVPRRPPAGGTATEDRDSERSLVGSGTSQVSIGAALRARDAARPTEADLAAAEDGLVLVRRNWVPREDLSGRKA